MEPGVRPRFIWPELKKILVPLTDLLSPEDSRLIHIWMSDRLRGSDDRCTRDPKNPQRFIAISTDRAGEILASYNGHVRSAVHEAAKSALELLDERVTRRACMESEMTVSRMKGLLTRLVKLTEQVDIPS